MITINKYADKPNRVWLELYGLSTDKKPIGKFEDVFVGMLQPITKWTVKSLTFMMKKIRNGGRCKLCH